MGLGGWLGGLIMASHAGFACLVAQVILGQAVEPSGLVDVCSPDVRDMIGKAGLVVAHVHNLISRPPPSPPSTGPAAPAAGVGGGAAAVAHVQARLQAHQEAHRGPHCSRVPGARQGQPTALQVPGLNSSSSMGAAAAATAATAAAGQPSRAAVPHLGSVVGWLFGRNACAVDAGLGVDVPCVVLRHVPTWCASSTACVFCSPAGWLLQGRAALQLQHTLCLSAWLLGPGLLLSTLIQPASTRQQ